MQSAAESLALLLDGKPAGEIGEFCDFSLSDQNKVSLGKGESPSAPAEFKPILMESVTYIVAAVLINKDGDVLMMQEAKRSCYGKWYLPAGRMEPGEDAVEAAIREVKEETGLYFVPTTLLQIETAGGSWYRFVFTGNIIGGHLKTPENKDSESLQAKWIEDPTELRLRGADILPLIHRGRQFMMRKPDDPWHELQLPVIRPHKRLVLKPIITTQRRSDNRVCVLISENISLHFPICEINPHCPVRFTLLRYMAEIFGTDLASHTQHPYVMHGLLNIEHSGKPTASNDGVCISLLVSVRTPPEDICLRDKYTWLQVEKSLGDKLLSRMGDNLTIPLSF